MKNSSDKPLVGILMGSDSDWPTMKAAADALTEFGVASEAKVISAHRDPHGLEEYVSTAIQRGLKVIIAGAGGAAHLPGVTAAFTILPVIGVPILGKAFDGYDSLLAIVQMPPGVPVATVAVGGGRNAGILAVQIQSAPDGRIARQEQGARAIIFHATAHRRRPQIPDRPVWKLPEAVPQAVAGRAKSAYAFHHLFRLARAGGTHHAEQAGRSVRRQKRRQHRPGGEPRGHRRRRGCDCRAASRDSAPRRRAPACP